MKILGSSLKLLYACTCFTAIQAFSDASSSLICKLIFKNLIF